MCENSWLEDAVVLGPVCKWDYLKKSLCPSPGTFSRSPSSLGKVRLYLEIFSEYGCKDHICSNKVSLWMIHPSLN